MSTQFPKYDKACNDSWTYCLINSYNNIKTEVYKTINKELSLPVIEINPVINAKWGSWNPTSRVMTFSSKLLRSYEWSAVEYVMRHEIAHQIVSEIFDMDCYGVSHGEAWQRACDIVDIEPKRCSSVNFLSSFKGETKNSMVEKVSKLLIHANDKGATKAEAELFMNKAQELMLKHNIKMNDDMSDRIYIKRPFGLNYRRFPSWLWQLGRLLEQHYNVKHIKTYCYLDGKLYYRLELFGEPSNLDIAEYVGHALMTQADYLYSKYKLERAEELKIKKSQGYINYHFNIIKRKDIR